MSKTYAGTLPLQLLQEVLYREPAERIQWLGKISDAEGSLYRRFFSPAHIRAASQVSSLPYITSNSPHAHTVYDLNAEDK